MKSSCMFICLLYFFLFTGSVSLAKKDRNMNYLLQDTISNKLAADIYVQYLSSNKKIEASENADVDMVNQVIAKLTDAVSKYYRSIKSVKALDGIVWEINMVQESKEDTWCLPGGKMIVYSELLPVTQSEASLAVMLSHNMAHLLLHHGEKRMNEFLKDYLGGKDLAQSLTEKPEETKDFFKMAYGNGEYYGVIKGFTLSDEIEADRLGAIFCAMAGYNPKKSIVFWERMKFFINTGRDPHLLTTHRYDAKRLDRLNEIIDEISKKYFNPITKK